MTVVAAANLVGLGCAVKATTKIYKAASSAIKSYRSRPLIIGESMWRVKEGSEGVPWASMETDPSGNRGPANACDPEGDEQEPPDHRHWPPLLATGDERAESLVRDGAETDQELSALPEGVALNGQEERWHASMG
jgi:hypothetical protein